ncbi:chromosomal replication initiator protein DnaA [Treponema sp.]|uniref:chromosomal replication initiator protein DnaA n=1 Tax=Treponema sp. TaxID=166 RepID=UPI00388DBF82
MSSQNFKIFWDEVLNMIQQEYIANKNSIEFEIWYRGIKYIEDSNSELTVSFPSKFMFNTLTDMGHIQNIKNKIKVLCGNDITIKPIYEDENSKKSALLTANSDTPSSVPINKTDTDDEIKSTGTDENKSVPINLNYSPVKEVKKHPQLREDYTFDRFVVGENNEFAYSASLAAAKDPGKKFNPLLIYGGTGLGKTHLMQSVGNYIYNNPPEGKENINICYITAENFTNEFTKSLREKTTEAFKSKYRKIDVLLLDDIHFFEKKDSTQDELFYTFEALFQRKSQMIFTCDSHPSKLNDIDERLKSRFNLGTPIDLQPPSYEMRIAILQKKLELKGKTAPAEVIEYVARNIQSNVRELEGNLNKLIGYAELMEKELTIELTKKLLSDSITGNTDESVTIDTILKVVCNYYNITIADIKGTARNPKFAMPRHIAVYLSRKLTDRTFTEIAGELGGRDHTTIMNSNKKIESLLKTDESMIDTLEILTRKIREYKKI